MESAMIIEDEEVLKEKRRSSDAEREKTTGGSTSLSPRRREHQPHHHHHHQGLSSSFEDEIMKKAGGGGGLSSSSQVQQPQRPKSRGPPPGGKTKEARESSSATDLARLEDTTRVDRLIREREQMRRNRSFSILDDDMKSEVSGAREDLDQKSTSEGENQPSVVGVDVQDKIAQAAQASTGRLIIAANRLPVSVKKGEDGKWGLTISSGGLVSALLGVGKSYGMLWVGWPGVFIDEGPDRDALTETLLEKRCLPIWLTRNQVELYYNGYCNNILWPLFNYVPLTFEPKLSSTKDMASQWLAYISANQLFEEAIMSVFVPGDIVWCHDYHLMLLPQMLRKNDDKMKIGWFLHTPFPSSEIYRTLPMREELLISVLKADLVGFHTYDYARHFVSSCSRILAFEGRPDGVEDGGNFTRVAAFPIGIDPTRFHDALATKVVQDHILELKARFKGRKVMLGVDRLDMIKGIPQKLLGYEKFLNEHPEWRDQVVLVQIAVPTRSDVPEYQKLTSQVHEIVGRINGRFGTLGSVPIQHLDCSLSFAELTALYAVTDCCLVTSLRDGMNLVSYEYVSCQSQNAGVLILSEFAGAAQSLGAGSILVNPWNVTEVAQAIDDALTMPETERRERHKFNFSHVEVHTSQAWADTFIAELNDTHVEAELRRLRIPPRLRASDLIGPFTESRQRLVILGFNATLTKKDSRSQADRIKSRNVNKIIKPKTGDVSPLHSVSQECIARLCDDPNTTVCIFSGSERHKLAKKFAVLPKVWIVAENGCFIRPPLITNDDENEDNNGDDDDQDDEDHREEKKDVFKVPKLPPKWHTLVEMSQLDWLESVQVVFEYFCERTPRSYVEIRETSLVWSYKYSDPDFGRQQARDLLQHLWTGPISNANVDIIQGMKSVEARPVGLSKGVAVDKIVQMIARDGKGGQKEIDFAFCAGHFLGRDEDIFTYLDSHTGDHDVSAESSRGGSPVDKQGNTKNGYSPTELSSGLADSFKQVNINGNGDFRDDASGRETPPTYETVDSENNPLVVTPMKLPERSAPRRQSSFRGVSGVQGSSAEKTGELGGQGPSYLHPNESFAESLGSVVETKKKKADVHFGSVFTCTVGRKRSPAHYFVDDSDQIAALLIGLVNNMNDGKGLIELLQFNDVGDEVSQEPPERSLSRARSVDEFHQFASQKQQESKPRTRRSSIDFERFANSPNKAGSMVNLPLGREGSTSLSSLQEAEYQPRNGLEGGFTKS
jgi:trehalose 6-phosphate synthase/phosphatase